MVALVGILKNDALFTANATAAMTSFIVWLTTDGGWSLGSNVNDSYDFASFDVVIQKPNGEYGETMSFVTSIIGDWELTDDSKYKRAIVVLEGTSLPFESIRSITTVNSDLSDYSMISYGTKFAVSNFIDDSYSYGTSVSVSTYISKYGLAISEQELVADAQYACITRNGFIVAGFIYDGYFYLGGTVAQVTP